MSRKYGFLGGVFFLSCFNIHAMISEKQQQYLNECLYSAMWNEQSSEAQIWLTKGANPNHIDKARYHAGRSTTSIGLVVQSGDVELLELMLTHKADPNECLSSVITQGRKHHRAMAELCIKYGAEVKNGKALTAAVYAHNIEMAKFLLGFVPIIEADGLGRAIFLKNTPMITLLLENGADVNAEINTSSPYRRRVFFDAYFSILIGYGYTEINSSDRNKEIIKLLEEHGVDYDLPALFGGSLKQWEERMGRRTVIKVLNEDRNYLFPRS